MYDIVYRLRLYTHLHACATTNHVYVLSVSIPIYPTCMGGGVGGKVIDSVVLAVADAFHTKIAEISRSRCHSNQYY